MTRVTIRGTATRSMQLESIRKLSLSSWYGLISVSSALIHSVDPHSWLTRLIDISAIVQDQGVDSLSQFFKGFLIANA